MAIFGTKKTEKKEATQRVMHARANKTSEGVAHEIIRAPWFSEKALLATEKGIYCFEVSARATKTDIAGAIKEIYNVAPRAIKTVRLPAKRKNMRTKAGTGSRAARHKAYVYLNKGDTIQFA